MATNYGFRLFILSLIVCAGLAITARAGENSLEKGAWALQFQVVQNFQLASFQGSTISIKKHTSDGTALRAGVSISLSLEDTDRTVTMNDTVGQSEDVDDNMTSFGLVVQMIKYPSPSAATNLYYGIGPIFTYSHSKDYGVIEDPIHGDTRSNDRKWTRWSTGVSTVVGIEWFPGSNISLLAEYNVSLYYEHYNFTLKTRRSSPERPERTTGSETNTDGFVLEGSSVKFGLSVYF